MKKFLVFILFLVTFIFAEDRYVVIIKIKQTHMSLDIFKHIKDDANAVKIEIPVDKKFYDAVKIGDVLNNDFRAGSFLMSGSIGNWSIKIEDKKVVKE